MSKYDERVASAPMRLFLGPRR